MTRRQRWWVATVCTLLAVGASVWAAAASRPGGTGPTGGVTAGPAIGRLTDDVVTVVCRSGSPDGCADAGPTTAPGPGATLDGCDPDVVTTTSPYCAGATTTAAYTSSSVPTTVPTTTSTTPSTTRRPRPSTTRSTATSSPTTTSSTR